MYIYIYTSSTAQGGGGSFKNRKPIGEVSCCGAKMAERTHWWIERWLSVSPFLSLFLSFSLCLSFAIYLQSYLSSHLPIYFFDISTSKSGPRPPVFNTFDFKIYFAPQRRALFRHRNFQKWSEPLVFCTFWLGNVLRATTACNFSSLIWPAGSAPAALASLLFEPPEPQIIGKTQCFATSLPFRASASSFFWLFLFSDLLSSNLSLLSASALLCFSSVHIVGSLASKLPSIIYPLVN